MGNRSYLIVCLASFSLALTVMVRQFSWVFWERQNFLPLLFIFTLICLIPAIPRLRQRRFDPFEPPIFMGLMYFLLFGVLTLPFLQLSPVPRLYSFLEEAFGWLNIALLYLCTGLIFLWLGYRSQAGVWVERLCGMREGTSAALRTDRVRFGWVLVLYLSGAAARLYRIRTGTFGYLVAQSPDVATSQLPFTNWLWSVELFCAYAQVLATIAYYTRSGLRERTTFWAIVSGELLFGFLSGFRTPIFLTFFYIAVVSFYMRRRLPWRAAMVGGLVLLFVFPLIPIYRALINRQVIDVRETGEVLSAVASVVAESVTTVGVAKTIEGGAEVASVHMSRLPDFAAAVRYATERGLYPERHVLWLFPFLVVVPRAVWPGKPKLELGGWVYREIFGGLGNSAFAATYPGGLYLYLGYWGYVAGMFLTGVLQRIAYRRYSLDRSQSAVFLAPFLLLAVANPDSDFVSHFAGFIQQLVVLIIISRLAIAPGRPERVLGVPATDREPLRPTGPEHPGRPAREF